MQKLTANNITDVALGRFGQVANPRFKEIMTSALRHLHDFVREVGLTPDEWKIAIDFWSPPATSPTRSAMSSFSCPTL
jgi:hydroxyquinol 1,2-dioxygenase